MGGIANENASLVKRNAPLGLSVTQRIKFVNQPRGGLLPMSLFNTIPYNDKRTLFARESIHPSLVGLAVDYLTRMLVSNQPPDEAFDISLAGARIMLESGYFDEFKYAYELVGNIHDLSDASVAAACRLVGYDSCMRAGIQAYKSVRDIDVDVNTISNVRTMVRRGVAYLNDVGPVVSTEPTFEGGGYTNLVAFGDGDYTTDTAFIDFKVIRSDPKPEHTLQLLMYYLMAKHSCQPKYANLSKLAIFNPRKNIEYVCSVSSIPSDIIATVERDVIGYGTRYDVGDAGVAKLRKRLHNR